MFDAVIVLGPILACAAAGATGTLFRPGPWYETLEKPSWTPPNKAFPIVWTSLYVLMAWAAARVGLGLAEGSPAPAAAAAGLSLWAAQITLNALWSPVFFGLRKPKIALAIIFSLWLLLLGCALAFGAADPVAGWMMAPALVWVAIAAGLNRAVLRLNPPSVFTAG